MRVFFPLLALLALFVALNPAIAGTKSTKITWGQMVDACGGQNSSGGGHVGCDALCNSSGTSICDYDCKGTGHCTKTVVAQATGGFRGGEVGAPGGVMKLPPPDLTSDGSTAAAGSRLSCIKRADQCLRHCDYPQHSVAQMRCTTGCAVMEISCRNGSIGPQPDLPPPSLSTSGSGMYHPRKQQGQQGPAGGVP